MKKTETIISDYRGSPIITIAKKRVEGVDEDDKYRNIIGFGLTKARAILENIEEIKRFVEENDKQ